MSPAVRIQVRKRQSKRRRRRSRLILPTAVALTLAAAVGASWLLWPYWELSGRLSEQLPRQPSRVYARPLRLEIDRAVARSRLEAALAETGYRRVAGRPRSGEYSLSENGLRVELRSGPRETGLEPGGLLEITLRGGRVADLRWRGEGVERAELEPPLLDSLYGPAREERRGVDLARLPSHLLDAVVAAEDSTFFDHQGISIRGVARAAWVNLSGGEVRQGGSTLTQQLVKNLFLSHERTWARKLREAALALLVELRHDKREILGAYLSEIYLGQSRGVNLMGVGAAAPVYFGKPAEELSLCESAVLAGMIRSPGGYSPVTRPEASRERRNWVLGRMAEEGLLTDSELGAARAQPLCVSYRPLTVRRAPYFVDAVAAEARERYGVGDLAEAGLSLLTTLDLEDQRSAEEALAWGLEALEEGWEKGRRGGGEAPLQGALVSLDPRDGAILAYVGGRDYAQSQYDRVSQALRQAGSAFKPVVYAAAFERGVASPSSLLEDSPLTVTTAGRVWSPDNSDGQFRGTVTARRALEESLNVPTARLALAVGLEEIVGLARRLGIRSRLRPFPALALGAFEVSPLELATVYATLAAAGRRPSVHGLRAVLSAAGEPLSGANEESSEQALSPQATYLLVSVLQGVLDRGTGAAARRYGIREPLAGKTGTTNDRRDSWFVGFSPDRASLVWVGYDDNSTTRLSGARAGLPIWSRFVWAVRPAAGYPVFQQPPGVATALVDPLTGELATGDCPQVLTEVFLEGALPDRLCHLHGGWREHRRAGLEAEEGEKRNRLVRWLKRVFARRERGEPEVP